MSDLQSETPIWKKRLQDAWDGVRRVTQLGVKKSEQISKLAKHQLKRGLLVRNRGKLYQELGEITFHLLQANKLSHEDLKRAFERIGAVNLAIQSESEMIARLQQEELPPADSL